MLMLLLALEWVDTANIVTHTCIYMFAPLHYGFVFFGWLALAIAGVLLQVFASFGNLIGDQITEAVDTGLISK